MSEEKEKPLYKHDCKQCTFLGRYDDDFDLYYCTQANDWPTVIARFSSYGPDYISGLYFHDCEALNVAKTRAIEMLQKKITELS